MGTYAPESTGFHCVPGSKTYIKLEPNSRKEADRLFKKLSEGGKIIERLTSR
jgi:PhnB protein